MDKSLLGIVGRDHAVELLEGEFLVAGGLLIDEGAVHQLHDVLVVHHVPC